MAEGIGDEDIPERFKTPIQDFLFYYAAGDKELARAYVSQLHSLDYTGCLYDDDTYLNWRHTLQYDLIHELSKRSVVKFFLVTKRVGEDKDLALHKCESLMMSISSNDNSLVPIFEISKNDIPDESQFYGLRTLTGLYSRDLKDGRKFKRLFNLQDNRGKKAVLQSKQNKSLKEWKEEKLRRQHQSVVGKEMEKQEKRDMARRIKEGIQATVHDRSQSKDPGRPTEKAFTQYHINIINAGNSSINIGTTYQGKKHSSQFERQFTIDGASSDESDSITREEDAEGAEQDISSLEFDIPKDPDARPKRILDVGKPAKQSQKANPDKHKSESEGEKKQPIYFDFNIFAGGDESKEETKRPEFSKNNLYQTKADLKAPSKDQAANENKYTDSRSVEVQPPSSQEAVMSTEPSKVSNAPPWTPMSSSRSLSQLENGLESDQQNQLLEESFKLRNLLKASLSNNTGSVIAKFNDLLSGEGISLNGKLKEKDSHGTENMQQETQTMSESLERADKSPESERCLNINSSGMTPRQPYSTPVSLRDNSVNEAMNVQVCKSEEFQNGSHTEEVVVLDINQCVTKTAQPVMTSNIGERSSQSDTSEHYHPAGWPQVPAGDSGIEMDEITDAKALLMSGIPQLSMISALGQPDKHFSGQNVAGNACSISCIATADTKASLNGCSKGVSCTKDNVHDCKPFAQDLPCAQEKTASLQSTTVCQQNPIKSNNIGVMHKDLKDIANAVKIQDDFNECFNIDSSCMSNQDHPVSEQDGDLQNDIDNPKGDFIVETSPTVDTRDNESKYDHPTDEECIQNLKQLTDDLEQLHHTGTWV